MQKLYTTYSPKILSVPNYLPRILSEKCLFICASWTIDATLCSLQKTTQNPLRPTKCFWLCGQISSLFKWIAASPPPPLTFMLIGFTQQLPRKLGFYFLGDLSKSGINGSKLFGLISSINNSTSLVKDPNYDFCFMNLC